MTTPEFDKAVSNFQKLEKFITDNVKSSSHKKEALLRVIGDNPELVLAPASTRREYHGAFPGGLVEHSLKVLKNLSILNKSFEAKLLIEEMVVVSIFHDIGKAGKDGEPYYLPKNSDWHESRGIFYEVNPVFNSMKVSQLSLYKLQAAGAVLSTGEYAAIYNFDQVNRDPDMPMTNEPALAVMLRQAIGISCHQGRDRSKISL